MLTLFLWTIGATTGSMLFAAALLHLLPRLGGLGVRGAGWVCQGIGLDLVITYFTVLPWFVGWFGLGWIGFTGAIVGQALSISVWTVLHELAHREAARGPRIVHVLNRAVGRWRNHTAVWWTSLAVPVFWIVRVAEWIVYPPLIRLIGLPRYNQSEWVNVSRQKFRGLVGHDLIWCLYCDWMTGIWSLGSEMLRNIESFWCPIRFMSDKKCENCRIDFPDIDRFWTPADGDIGQVAALLAEHYPPLPRNPDGSMPERPWFGHPARLTIKQTDPPQSAPGTPPEKPPPAASEE